MVQWRGGNGGTLEEAIVIEADSEASGVAAEYDYISQKHGLRDRDLFFIVQALIKRDGRYFDVIRIRLREGETLDYYFDITSFFGKWR